MANSMSRDPCVMENVGRSSRVIKSDGQKQHLHEKELRINNSELHLHRIRFLFGVEIMYCYPPSKMHNFHSISMCRKLVGLSFRLALCQIIFLPPRAVYSQMEVDHESILVDDHDGWGK